MATSSATIEKPLYTNGKHLALQIFLETMATIDVRHAMLAKVKLVDSPRTLLAGNASLPLVRPPRAVAFGKAANRMAATLDEILGGEVEAGVVVSPAEPERERKIGRFRYFVGGHPYPSRGSLEGAQAAMELLAGLTADDAVVFLVSGGGSALFEAPLDPVVTLADLFEFNRVLVTCGLPIEQINVLRKHISAVKGGRLGARAHPARQLTIFVSDVPERFNSMVASGPTMPDESKLEQCYGLAETHGLVAKFPATIRKLFEERRLEETPKPGDPRLEDARYQCLLSNRDAVEAARASAAKLGFRAEVDTSDWDRDYHEVVAANFASLERLAREASGQPACLVVGGEVVSPVTAPGMGGRNQAFVLHAAGEIQGQRRVVLSAGTDGRDGNSPVAGALADGQTVARARALDLDPAQYLAACDSYHFFRTLGDTIETGFTDNNVRDVRIWLDFGEVTSDKCSTSGLSENQSL
jgi:hydroxypyruvate reductase